MKKIICVALSLLAVFGFCHCSGIDDAINSESNLSTGSLVIENFSSKNNSTSYDSSSKPQSSGSVNQDSSINLHSLPIPYAKKTKNVLSKEEIYDIVVNNFEIELSKEIKFTRGSIVYGYDSYYFSWADEDDYPYVWVCEVIATLNAKDFKNLLNQLKNDWRVGKIDRMPYIPYEYEYIKDYTFEKKYKDVVIAEIAKSKTIYINKISDNEYIAEFNGEFYDPEFKYGTFDIQKDGTGKKRESGQS